MNIFCNRSMSVWNDLPNEWVSCDSVISFNSRLTGYDPCKYCTRCGKAVLCLCLSFNFLYVAVYNCRTLPF